MPCSKKTGPSQPEAEAERAGPAQDGPAQHRLPEIIRGLLPHPDGAGAHMLWRSLSGRPHPVGQRVQQGRCRFPHDIARGLRPRLHHCVTSKMSTALHTSSPLTLSRSTRHRQGREVVGGSKSTTLSQVLPFVSEARLKWNRFCTVYVHRDSSGQERYR